MPLIYLDAQMTHLGKFTCDEYKVDRIEKSFLFESEIRKYYVFASQFDVQLFENSMTFIENDGRGLYWV